MKLDTSISVEGAKQAILNFAVNPASILAGYWTTYHYTGNSHNGPLHCYPGIHEGQPALIILPAEYDKQQKLNNADIKICPLRSLPKPLTPPTDTDTDDFEEISLEVAQERIDRWINLEQRYNWFNRVGPYQCLVFPTDDLIDGHHYTVYLALSGTDSQLAGDLIMMQNDHALSLYDTVQLIPPFGESEVTQPTDFALFNEALVGTTAAPDTHPDINTPPETTHVSPGPPALIAISPDVYIKQTNSQPSTLVCAFEREGDLKYTLSTDGGIKWEKERTIAPKVTLKKAPAMDYTMKHIYCVFISKEGDSEVLAWSRALRNDPKKWSNPRIIKSTQPGIPGCVQTITGVSVCVVGLTLFCMYSTAPNGLHLISINLSSKKAKWHTLNSPETSNQPVQYPALWFINSTLFCAFTGVSDQELLFSRSTNGGKKWSKATPVKSDRVENSATGAPGLCVKNNTIFCLFNSSGKSGQLRIIASFDRGKTWSGNQFIGGIGTTRSSPAVCSSASNVYAAWLNYKGHIEVATSLDGLSWSQLQELLHTTLSPFPTSVPMPNQ